jgi:hypothetical protein
LGYVAYVGAVKTKLILGLVKQGNATPAQNFAGMRAMLLNLGRNVFMVMPKNEQKKNIGLALILGLLGSKKKYCLGFAK